MHNQHDDKPSDSSKLRISKHHDYEVCNCFKYKRRAVCPFPTKPRATASGNVQLWILTPNAD
jgi:hypothetical protein